MPPRVPVRVSDHPAARAGLERVRDVLARLDARAELEVATDPADAAAPSLTVDGLEVLAGEDPPPAWVLEAALLRALRPRSLLFLCVANSARSQMAEGLARAMAPAGVRVASAGSSPTSVRPQAVQALAEVGIDISDHTSTAVDDVEGPVDAVITLCAEEVCPVWLGEAVRLHWGMPDPAGAGESPDEEMEAFRRVRDELRRRFEVLFAP